MGFSGTSPFSLRNVKCICNWTLYVDFSAFITEPLHEDFLLVRLNCSCFVLLMREEKPLKNICRKITCIVCIHKLLNTISYYKSSSVCLFVCLSVCLFVPYLLRGPLTDLRQTWWVYVGGPQNCPWGVLFRKGQRLDGSTGHFHFPLYYICASLTPHSCKRRLCCYCN